MQKLLLKKKGILVKLDHSESPAIIIMGKLHVPLYFLTSGYTMALAIFLLYGAFSTPWPSPNASSRPIFHVGGLDNAPGYVGDGLQALKLAMLT